MALLSASARHRRQQRQQILWTILRVAVAVGLLAFTAFSAFEVGVARNVAELRLQQEELSAIKERERGLIEDKAVAEEDSRRLGAALARLEEQYAANVPEGPTKALMAAVEKRLAAGVSEERLTFVIQRAGAERKCEREIETKRVQVRTPIATDVENSIGFADNRITLSAEGQPARDDSGRPEAWFDPALPVVLRFLMISGDVERVESVLPATHSLVLNAKEYRFQLVSSERRGLIDVTAQVCDYP